MTDLVIPLRRLDPDLPLPAYAHPGDAGADLVAAEDVELAPGARALVRTGVAVAIPDGYVGLVHPRSGLAARLGVTVLNAPGTVDAGYRGEILVILVNHDRTNTVKISRSDRIAQLVVQRVERAVFHVVDELDDTAARCWRARVDRRALRTAGTTDAVLRRTEGGSDVLP